MPNLYRQSAVIVYRWSFVLLLALFGLFGIAGIAVTTAADPEVKPAAEPKPTPEQEAFFESKVRPLLVAKCYQCHAGDQQKGDVRVDSRPALLKGNESGPAVVPGKPEESRLIEVISYEDAIRMPPKGKLSADEIAILTTWVQSGAAFPGGAAVKVAVTPTSPEGIAAARQMHWSYQPVTIPTPPAVKNEAWSRHPVDRFILAKLEEQGLTPSPAADRRTLLRRVTFDLTGLPPTLEEVTAFEADRSADAFAKVVDRLLASPHYGERWGRHWLDVARYADTKGYVFTEERKYPYSYTYRDYVVRAFNEDLPFNQFIIEQLAADLLPAEKDNSALAALGFITLGRRFTNNKHDIIDDRIDTVTRGLMGMTVSCARCHDHKFDPIPTEDYYSLYGVFASCTEPAELPQIGQPVDNEAYRAYLAELHKREAALDNYIAEKQAALVVKLQSQSMGALVAAVPMPKGASLPDEIKSQLKQKKQEEVKGDVKRRWQTYLKETAKQHHPVFAPWHELGRLPADKFAGKAPEVFTRLEQASDTDPKPINPLVRKALLAARPKSMWEVAIVYGNLLEEINQQWLKSQSTEAPAAVAATTGSTPPASTSTAAGSQPAPTSSASAKSEVASAPTSSTPLPTSLSDPAAEQLRQVLYATDSPTALTPEEARRLFDRVVRSKITQLKNNVVRLQTESPAAPPRAMVINDLPKPSPAKVFIRGNPGRQGPEIPRRFLRVVSTENTPSFDKDGSGRLELAKAIASPGNPLTARVIVNRVWLHHFGAGIVGTPSDFGSRGALPSHPELLDYLAGTFMANGWSIKKLHRQILLSKTYQQASNNRPECASQDPENHLLWKMNRQRLEFEPMRDSLLAVTGHLDQSLGGHPVDIFKQPFSDRRSIYAFIDRQDMPGVLLAFDFASPDATNPQRPQTTVPQQALFGLNSDFVVQQARRLAARSEITSAATAESKIRALYRIVFARQPTAAELSVGSRFLAIERSPADVPQPVWQYGYGTWGEAEARLSHFEPFAHFVNKNWHPEEKYPGPKFGYVSLTATGGHPGNGLERTSVRRWTAPHAGRVKISGTLQHASDKGDGVRGRIVAGTRRDLGHWQTLHSKQQTVVKDFEVQAGETVDFIVDSLKTNSYDSFTWTVQVEYVGDGDTQPHSGGKDANRRVWKSDSDFAGPPPPPLTPLQEYAQALLLTNEFVFVD